MKFIGSWSNVRARYTVARHLVAAHDDIGYEELNTGSYTFAQPLTQYDRQRNQEALDRAQQAERELMELNARIAQSKR